VVVVRDYVRLRRNAQRCEFPILWIRDEDEALRIDGAKKLRFGLEKISDAFPVQVRDLAQDSLGGSARSKSSEGDPPGRLRADARLRFSG